MADFKKPGGFGGRGGGDRGGFRGGRPSFGGKSGFRGGRDGDHKEMFDAICANCGKPCKVPFRPNGEKPVYCNDCFHAQKEGAMGGAGRHDDRGPRAPFANAKRDFTPAPAPVAGGGDRRLDDMKRQMEGMNSKLDKIMQMMSPASKASEKKGIDPTLGTTVQNAMASAKKPAKKIAPKKKSTSKKK